MSLTILHQDDELVAVSKPGGLMVHRSTESSDTRFLLQLLRDQLGGDWLYPLHRLDRAASGIVLFARSSEGAARWQPRLNGGGAQKEYLALVRGATAAAWEMKRALTDRETGKKRPAHTAFVRVEEIDLGDEHRFSLVRARLHTGRRHQIRRHLSRTRNQIVGDTNYGKGQINRYLRAHFGLPRMFLHATRLVLQSGPDAAVVVDISDPLPADLQGFLGRLRAAGRVEKAVDNPVHKDLEACGKAGGTPCEQACGKPCEEPVDKGVN